MFPIIAAMRRSVSCAGRFFVCVVVSSLVAFAVDSGFCAGCATGGARPDGRVAGNFRHRPAGLETDKSGVQAIRSSSVRRPFPPLANSPRVRSTVITAADIEASNTGPFLTRWRTFQA